ncbi:hypothetical protein JDV02_009814 [Purpureocillium takamizusanense]|uniref:Uncharacterized protein n=1 Tax=Purpureocillium takamizusanense TaxID=2060973 RepID=A0A9Q8VGL7_9HYPO|nr:uncharacterized protein JDV02_009814 [Purpureocillium takamizusanense]UNI24034.1 hypothetical protein JDV02_009814 [Purpureocillium takamizusanense]
MFGFRKTLDIITVFHKAGSPASTRVANLLKEISVNLQTGATMDQASNYTLPKRDPFDLNITEEPPTPEQVQTILEYVGKDNISQIIKGARDEKDALRKFKESKENFVRPVVSVARPMRLHRYPLPAAGTLANALQTVDWNNGKAIAGANDSEILKLVNATKL